ncbi:MAG: hypothetical protein OQL28_04310 [Sedimenticola sp.]|nr:hypothetical protein [Sedimenticola sp.]
MSRLFVFVLTLLIMGGPVSAAFRDPMQPFGYRPGEQMSAPDAQSQALQPDMFRLSAIFCGPRGKRAVINDRHLEEGDEIDGASLLNIDSYSVELEMQGKKIKLELLPITVKTPSKGLSGGGK